LTCVGLASATHPRQSLEIGHDKTLDCSGW
jgi:hypothetical protein